MATLEADRGSRTVEATVMYTRRADEPLRTYFQLDPPPGEQQSNREDEPHEVSIASMREIPDGPRLDREGFQLADFSTTVDANDIYDAEQREQVYGPELAEMLKNITGASEVVVTNHITRGPEAQRRNPKAHQAATQGFAHADYVPASGSERLRDYFPEHADEIAERRTAIVNIWRPIEGPMRDRPLAVCDVRTLDVRDLRNWLTIAPYATPAMGSEAVRTSAPVASEFMCSVLTWNEALRWYYVPDMMPDEALLFYQYDSKRPDLCYPHTAFADPTTPSDALPRASIDSRAFLLW